MAKWLCSSNHQAGLLRRLCYWLRSIQAHTCYVYIIVMVGTCNSPIPLRDRCKLGENGHLGCSCGGSESISSGHWNQDSGQGNLRRLAQSRLMSDNASCRSLSKPRPISGWTLTGASLKFYWNRPIASIVAKRCAVCSAERDVSSPLTRVGPTFLPRLLLMNDIYIATNRHEVIYIRRVYITYDTRFACLGRDRKQGLEK